jgi:hypothetical protein
MQMPDSPCRACPAPHKHARALAAALPRLPGQAAPRCTQAQLPMHVLCAQCSHQPRPPWGARPMKMLVVVVVMVMVCGALDAHCLSASFAGCTCHAAHACSSGAVLSARPTAGAGQLLQGAAGPEACACPAAQAAGLLRADGHEVLAVHNQMLSTPHLGLLHLHLCAGTTGARRRHSICTRHAWCTCVRHASWPFAQCSSAGGGHS